MKALIEKCRKEILPLIESDLQGFFVSKATENLNHLSEMSSYHLSTGGKRLRALMPSILFAAHGKDPREAIPVGMAVELIHNATLVHDDLQDGDEVRRGKPTVWKKYGIAQSINCGDALFYFGVQALKPLKAAPEIKWEITQLLMQGTLNVIEGQAQEFLMKEEDFPKTDRYVSVIRGKTSALFAMPVSATMRLLGYTAAECDLIATHSMNLGALFQIQDDLLDVYGDKGRDQKATDVAEGKVSILVAHVNEVGSKEDKRNLKEIFNLPREKTTTADIQTAIQIFDRYQALQRSAQWIRRIQTELRSNGELASIKKVRDVLVELSDVFLEPLNGIV